MPIKPSIIGCDMVRHSCWISSTEMLSLLLLSSFIASGNQQQITVADGSLSRPPTLQVDGEGRAFVAAGRQLLRLNSELVPEQNITLSAGAVNISLSSGEERLVVCLEDSSCAVYNTSDLLAQPFFVQVSALTDVVNRVALFTAGDSFYVGSYDPTDLGAGVFGTIRLGQVGGSEGIDFVRSVNYEVFEGLFQRDFFAGFMSGPNAYYIASDTSPSNTRGIKVMRLCHVTGCPGESGVCGISALYEELLICGERNFGAVEDGVCGVSVVEDFAGTTGTGIVISRCRQGFHDNNVVCFVPVSQVDRVMDTRYDSCSMGISRVNLHWGIDRSCAQSNFHGVCDFTGEVGDIGEPLRPPEVITIGTDVGIGTAASTITASVAVQLDGLSLVVVAYTLPNNGGNSIAMFAITPNQVPADAPTAQTLDLRDAFGMKQSTSVVRTLQWHPGLDYVLAATDMEVLRIPVEECSSSLDCSSCVTNGNPLCGWCVVEDKCSRQSQCQNGNSTDSIRWRSSSSIQCIAITVTPNQYLLDDQQVLNISVSGPGLPAVIRAESFSCHFEDSLGRFNITVPSIFNGTQYMCDITNRVQQFGGVQTVMHFSFVSSLVGIPFDTADNALTVFNCTAASRCTDCLGTGVCGWCVVNKLCRGTPQNCTDSGNFLQLNTSETFEDVCPLLDLNEGTTNYTQHVRVANSLQLTTRNLPDIVPEFSYMCRIGDTVFSAMRNNEFSLTCQIGADLLIPQLSVMSPTEIADISIIWLGPGVVMHPIDAINSPKVTVYDCNLIAGDCSSCIGSRATPGILCGWCDHSSDPTCSIDIDTECIGSPSFYTTGQHCPEHMISSFSPSSGPPSGGTIITIRGRDLGVAFADFSAPNSITIGGVSCTPLGMGYESGTTVLCQTARLSMGPQDLVITLPRNGSVVSVPALSSFMVIRPTLVSVEPEFGPIAGGSELRVSGTGLDIGNTARVTLNGTAGPECSIRGSPTATEITCITPNVTSEGSGPVVIQIDNEIIPDEGVTFEYRSNPTFTSVMPKITIPVGGITVTFTGENLNVAKTPQLMFSNGARSPCTVESSTTLTCITPPVDATAAVDMPVSYVLVLDDAPFPEDRILPNELQISVGPTPTGFRLTTVSVRVGAKSRFIKIAVMNLVSVEVTEITVFVGGEPCGRLSKSADNANILCEAPDGKTLNLNRNRRASVDVRIGTSLSVLLEETLLYEEEAANDISIIIPAVVAPPTIIFLCCVVCILVIISLRKKRYSTAKRNSRYF